jgi:uncharacterized membrane protein YfcA
MDTATIVALLLVTLAAYFIKGLAGFGPALLIVPFFTLFAGVELALPASAFFDVLAGTILLSQVYRQIHWQFCFPLMLAMGLGSFTGAQLVFYVPLEWIRGGMGIFILLFALFLWTSASRQNHSSGVPQKHTSPARYWYGTLTGFVGGICGGMIGMSGPPVIMYMKRVYSKDFFRTQLIVVFMVENLVRLLVYQKYQLLGPGQGIILLFCLVPLVIGLWLGSHLHLRISERHFNRTVALILLIVSIKILWS